MSDSLTASYPVAVSSRGRVDWGAVSGIAFVPLMVAAFALAPNIDTAADDASATITAYYADPSNGPRGRFALLAGTAAAFCLCWFAARLRAALDAAESRPSGGLGTVAYGGGLVFAALLLVNTVVSTIVGATVEFSDTYRLDPNLAMLLGNASYYLISVAMAGVAVLLLATAAVSRRTRVLPAWLTWFAFILVVLSLAATVLFMIPLLLFLAWVLATSFVLMRRSAA